MIYKKTWKPILRHNPPTKLEDMKANPKTSNGTAWKIGKQLIH